MIETLIGGIFGGVLRTLPAVLDILDKKDERKHALAMQTLLGSQKAGEITATNQGEWNKGAGKRIKTFLFREPGGLFEKAN